MVTQKERNCRQNELRKQAEKLETEKDKYKLRGRVVREKKTPEELKRQAIEAGIL